MLLRKQTIRIESTALYTSVFSYAAKRYHLPMKKRETGNIIMAKAVRSSWTIVVFLLLDILVGVEVVIYYSYKPEMEGNNAI